MNINYLNNDFNSKMSLDELKIRLCNLVLDLTFNYQDFQKILMISSMTKADKDNYFRDMYMKDQLPVKVVDYERAYIKRDQSMEFYDNFIMGLDEYIQQEERKVTESIKNYYMAAKIFKCILEIKSPQSDILYLLYCKKLTNREAMRRLYISKPTFYRKKQRGMTELLAKINETT